MSIPLVDLRAQYRGIKMEVDQAIQGVLNSGEFILGKEVRAFEDELAAHSQSRYAVGVGSGTEALHLALLACGVGPGDEVITTPFTFIATAEVIQHCGARPVFADIEPDTYNLDWRRVEEKITRRTRAIIPVHLYGQSADMAPLLALARRHGLKVIEDCAQALGARYQGQPVGGLGDVGCFSFFPSKNLGAYGDGGLVTTNSAEVAEKVDLLRKHGSHPKEKYYHLAAGFNSRLDTLQAAVLRVKLRYLDGWIARRQERAAFYNELLAGTPGIKTPDVAPYAQHSFNYYTIQVTNPAGGRDQLRQRLTAQGIATAIYYPISLHLQPAFASLGYQAGDFPQSERVQEEVISLPMCPELSATDQEQVAKAIKEFAREPVRA